MHNTFSKSFFNFSFVVFLLLSPIVMTSCNSDSKDSSEQTKENNLTISGEISGAEGQTVYLEAASQNGVINVAESKISGGKFDFSTYIPGLGIYQLRVGQHPDNSILLTAAPGDKITVKSSFENFITDSKVSGVEWGAYYGEYMKLVQEFSSKEAELIKMRETKSQKELVAIYRDWKAPMIEFAKNKIRSNPSNSFNIVLMNDLMPIAGFDGYPYEHVEILSKMAAAFQKKYSDSPITRTISDQVAQIESGYKEYEIIQSGVKPAPEIEMETPEGKKLLLSSLRGKVVLVDFWASWCGPCRKENPNIVRLYNTYKDKGFTIYSVSLDMDRSSWENAIAVDGLIWPNHVSDLLGWKSYITKLYGFNSIPHTVLVGKDGNIIAEGLRGADLEEKLKEVLK